MQRLKDIVAFLDGHLQTSLYRDASLNGLQVEGRAEVERVALGVSASLQLFEEADRWGAQAVLVHHGLFWSRTPPIVGPLAHRVRALLTADISLLAYHLPLDAHEEDGNNALLAQGLSLHDLTPWGTSQGVPIGWLGRLGETLGAEALAERVGQVCDASPLVLGPRRDSVSTVAVCSGSGGSLLDQAIAAGADAFVTGEPSESAQQLAFESDMVVIGAGHYNTERSGVQALGRRLESELDLDTRFFDIPNPV